MKVLAKLLNFINHYYIKSNVSFMELKLFEDFKILHYTCRLISASTSPLNRSSNFFNLV